MIFPGLNRLDAVAGASRLASQLAVVGMAGLLSLTGCGSSSSDGNGLSDADVDPGPDAGLAPTGDEDGDGICNATEIDLGLDPRSNDTDGDSYVDLVEELYALDSMNPSSPDRGRIAMLVESPASTTQVRVSIMVEGEGLDYKGAFEGPDTYDPFGVGASDFYQGSVAEAATPASNVALVEESNERFRGVLGNTQLTFEVRLGFGDNFARECTRLYPFSYNVKRGDGIEIAHEQYFLLVLPPATRLSSEGWCPLFTGSCL